MVRAKPWLFLSRGDLGFAGALGVDRKGLRLGVRLDATGTAPVRRATAAVFRRYMLKPVGEPYDSTVAYIEAHYLVD